MNFTEPTQPQTMAETIDDPFLDLEGEFEEVVPEDDTLSRDDQIQEAIGEQSLRKSYWRISFRRVQYGTYHNEPACLIVVDGRFHAEDRKRHRFIWAKITIDFQDKEKSVEVQETVPEEAYGITVPEYHSSSWSIR